MPDRAPGFYWVRCLKGLRDFEWIVAQYVGEDSWWVCGEEFGRYDDAFWAEIGPRVESPEEMRAAGRVLAYIVQRFEGVEPEITAYGTREEAEADSCKNSGVVYCHEITSPDLRRLRSQLRDAEEEKADLERRLAYAHGEIEGLRQQLRAVKPGMATSGPARET